MSVFWGPLLLFITFSSVTFFTAFVAFVTSSNCTYAVPEDVPTTVFTIRQDSTPPMSWNALRRSCSVNVLGSPLIYTLFCIAVILFCRLNQQYILQCPALLNTAYQYPIIPPFTLCLYTPLFILSVTIYSMYSAAAPQDSIILHNSQTDATRYRNVVHSAQPDVDFTSCCSLVFPVPVSVSPVFQYSTTSMPSRWAPICHGVRLMTWTNKELMKLQFIEVSSYSSVLHHITTTYEIMVTFKIQLRMTMEKWKWIMKMITQQIFQS